MEIELGMGLVKLTRHIMDLTYDDSTSSLYYLCGQEEWREKFQLLPLYIKQEESKNLDVYWVL